MSANKHLTRAEVEAREEALRAHCNPVSRSTEGPTRALPSDAPAITIARLSVELAAARADVARMREALGMGQELARHAAATGGDAPATMKEYRRDMACVESILAAMDAAGKA